MLFAIVGDGWSAGRFHSLISRRGWTSESVELPRDPLDRQTTLRAFARRRPDVNAFIVTTPPSVQIRDANTLVAEGLRVLIEKPVGLDEVAVRALQALAWRTDAQVLTAYHLAVNPLVSRLRASGMLNALGTIQHARFRMDVSSERPARAWLHDPGQSGGMIVETLTHGFQLLDLLIGPIEDVVAAQEQPNRAATVLLRHVSGATSSIEGVWGARQATRSGHVELFGAHGAAGLYRSDKVAYELNIDVRGHKAESWREVDQDAGFRTMLENIGGRGPLATDIDRSAGLAGAVHALKHAVRAQAMATGVLQ